ncbi:MAG: PKD domain-containing protein [Caldimonas sp.]
MNIVRRVPAPHVVVAFIAAALLAACGGGNDAATPPPPPAGNTAPVAAFTSDPTVPAGTPLAFDASTSSDADGDALSHSWSFGNGERGGGAKIAHVYAEPGSYTVRLTVDDGKGGSASLERSVTVTAGPVAMGNVSALALVRDAAGVPLSGVTVTNLAGGATASTGGDGKAQVGADREVPVALRFAKPGYADQIKAFTIPEQAESGYLEVTMGVREAALTLADAAAGGTLSGKDGARVTFAPGTLVDSAGAAAAGAVDVTITPIDVAANLRAFPGRFAGVRTTGESGLIMSYGTVEFALSQGGAPVQLAAGKKATIEIPAYVALHRDGSAVAAGDVIPLWSLNERTGDWSEEGSGTMVAANTPSGFALRAEVSHFSWWNADQWASPPGKPKPKCLVDSNADGVLEDLTGTGYCWNAGTGPEQPDKVAASTAPGGRKFALAEPRTQRIPTFVAEDFTPAAGGKILPIPADMDITFRSYAKNGTLFGTKVVRLGANVEADVPIVLEPVQDNPGTLAITALPYLEHFAMVVDSEIDRFTFDAVAGESYEVRVSHGPYSLLAGSARISGAAGQSLGGGSFGATDFSTIVTPASAATLTIEVDAAANAPGSYEVQVRKLAATNCASPIALTVPSSGNYNVGANNVVCFDIALAADAVLEIKDIQHIGLRGRATLLAPSGVPILSDTYASQDLMYMRLGIATSGTYRLVIDNANNNAGTVTGLSLSILPTVGTLGVPDSATFTSAATGGSNSRLYLLKPGAAAPEVALKLAARGVGEAVLIWPARQAISATTTAAQIVKTDPALLTVVEVLRLQPSSSGWNYTLSASTPLVLPRNSDNVLLSPAPGDLDVYRIDGSVGQEWSLGISFASGTGINPVASLHAPSSANLVNPQIKVYTLPEDGPYTLVVQNTLGSAGKPFKLRVNDAAPIEAIALSAQVERSGTLALGEVRRYGFGVVPSQVLRLQLASPDPFAVTALINGGAIYNSFVALSNGGSVATPALYAQQGAAAVLSVYGTSTADTRAIGAFTVDVQSPTPQPASLGQPLAPTLDPGAMASYALAIASNGRYLLCTSYAGPLDTSGGSLVVGTVWGPSASFINYTGDIDGRGQGNTLESIGVLRAGANTLSLASSLAAATPVSARLLALVAPTDVVPGGAATNGSIAACERRYLRFVGTAGATYTVRVTAQFAGSVRIRALPPNGDWSVRTDPPLSTNNLGATPSPLLANTERVVTFTLPATVASSYIVEIDADGDGSGNFTASLTSP